MRMRQRVVVEDAVATAVAVVDAVVPCCGCNYDAVATCVAVRLQLRLRF